MRRSEPRATRVDELRAMLAAYRMMTVAEVEDGLWGDQQIEIEGELWRLEQESIDRSRRPVRAA